LQTQCIAMDSPEYLKKVHDKLYSAVICDALDSMGFTNQSPRIQFNPYTGINKMMGRCKNTLWEDIYIMRILILMPYNL
jgi:hypothetical protein